MEGGFERLSDGREEEGEMSGGERAKGERLKANEGLKAKGRGERVMSKGGFKELRVWQKGKGLAVYIYQIYQKKHLRR